MPPTFQIDVAAVLRRAEPGDASAILDLYGRLDDPNILPRSRPEHGAPGGLQDGDYFVLDSDGTILGVCGIFSVDDPEPFVELGGTAVDLPARHLGLQSVFLAARVCDVLLHRGESFPDRIVTAADPESAGASYANIVGSGFHPIRPRSSFLAACATCRKRDRVRPERACCCTFFGLTAEAAARCVAGFLAAEGVRENAGRGRRLRLASRLFPDPAERDRLLAFAAGARPH